MKGKIKAKERRYIKGKEIGKEKGMERKERNKK